MTPDEYSASDALTLARLVREKQVTPRELLDLALDRTRVVNPKINAVVTLMEEEARDTADSPPPGPFSGVPFLAKDLVSQYAGHPTSAGSRLLKDLPAERDSELVRRVRASGLVTFGKTNLPEWGLVPYTEPELFGPCRNPWDLTRIPGGSSGGSAAAVAAGIVPMAGGGDGGGSIRIPASCCGLFGLKPTRARTPTGPDYGLLWRGAVVEHVVSRSVRDSATMLDATEGSDAGAPFEIAPPSGPFAADVDRDPGRLRIAFTSDPLLPADVHPDCVKAVEDAARLLEDCGHEVVEAAPPVDGPAFAHAFLTMVAAELGADLNEYRRVTGRGARRSELEPATWALGLLAGAYSAGEYAIALRDLERAGRVIGAFFEAYDMLLTPTLASPPPHIGELAPTAPEVRALRWLGSLGSGRLIRAAGLLDRAAETAFSFTPFAPLFNVTGQPAMSVPLFWNDEGLPIGVQLVSAFGTEGRLFQLAGQLERARPWSQRRPRLADQPEAPTPSGGQA